MEMDTQQLVLVFKLMQQVQLLILLNQLIEQSQGRDILTYTITVPNTGTGSAENVVLRDSIPNGTTFVAGSVTVGE